MKKLSIGLALLFVFTLTFSATMTFTENAVAAPCGDCCIIECPTWPGHIWYEGHFKIGQGCVAETCDRCIGIVYTCLE